MSELSATNRTFVSGFIVKNRKRLLSIAILVCAYALLGFFLAPWLVKTNAIKAVSNSLDAELSLEKVSINPFSLSLRINGLRLDDIGGGPLASVSEIFVNFQLSSLFRWAWTFNEFHITGPELFLARDKAGALNVAGVVRDSPETAPAPETEADGSVPRLLILDFAVRGSVVTWHDLVPVEPVETVFGPVNIQISELNTLPVRPGQQEVVITTETNGTLSWSGSLQLNPFNSSGRASIEGSHFPLMSAYMRHETGLDIVDGTADIGLDYAVETDADGTVRVSVDNFKLTFSDVRVRNFRTGVANDSSEKDLLALPSVSLSGGALRWPEQTLSIETLTIDDAVVNVKRNANGGFDLGAAGQEEASQEYADNEAIPDEPNEPAAGNQSWVVSLQQFGVNRLAFDLVDESVTPAADVGVESLDLQIREISNKDGAAFPMELALVPRSGGHVVLDGNLALLPSPILDFELNVDSLALAGAHPYLKPLADVNLDSGALNLAAQLHTDADEPLLVSGDLDIVDFLITETDEGSRLGSWARMDARNFVYSVAQGSFETSEVSFVRPYADILIAEDGSVNLGRISKSDSATDEDQAAMTEAAAAAPDKGIAVTIGRVIVEDAAADFVDRSLPLPFAAKIANLNGDMTTISTVSSEPSTVAMEGTVDEFGFVRISGSTTPLNSKLNTDLTVAFQNVEMPKFSAYTIPFAGREIASGKLDLDLRYRVSASELAGENKIVLRDLELGDKVPHPGAMSLPLGLAVALLKDPQGKIDIDLPVSGNVDDPNFHYGGVALKALGTLIVKIVASPFALLGNLLGVEASELEYVSFLPGRTDLTPPEVERAGRLAEALALRPQLVLELRGIWSRRLDGTELQAAKLEALVASRVPEATTAAPGDAMYAEQRLLVLEQLFTESGSESDPAAALTGLRQQFTTQAEGAPEKEGSAQFDALAYAAELQRLLIDLQPVTDAEFVQLANDRAANVRDAVRQANPDLEGRIVVADPQEVEAEPGEQVRMKVELRTGSEQAEDQEAET